MSTMSLRLITVPDTAPPYDCESHGAACLAGGALALAFGLDARDGKVATDGWSKLTGHEVVDLAKKFEGYGVEAIEALV